MAKLELQIGDKTYDKAWVDDLSSTSQISTDPAGINYGVIPSTGSAKLRDLGGAIRADIEAGVLPASNAQTKIRINDNQIQEHTTSDSDYNVINRELNLDFSDRLSLLDKVTYGGMPLRDYSMSAYEMFDDVIGSYGGYVKEIPRNWDIYYSSGKITFDSSTKMKVEIPYLNGHVEKIGTSIKLKKGVAHKISFSIKTSSFSLTAGTTGLQAIITGTYPTAANLDKTAIASANITSDTTNMATLEFTPRTDVVYFVLMLNNAAISQTFTITISTFVLDGRSNKDLLNSPHSRNLYVSGSTLAAGSESLYDYLDSVLISYPYLESASYRETIEKFCTLAQMTLSLDENGDIRFKSARPQIFSSGERTNTPIIDANHKISNFNKTLFLKNKVDGVDIKQSLPTATTDFNTVCFNKVIGSITDYSNNASNQTKTDNNNTMNAAVEFKTYYTTFSVRIPKKTSDGLKDIQRVITGKDNNDNSFVKYEVTWKYQSIGKNSGQSEYVNYEETETGNILTAKFYNANKPREEFCDPMGITIVQYISGTKYSVSAVCEDKSNTTTNDKLFKEVIDKNGKSYWEAEVTLLVGKEARYNLDGNNADDVYTGGRFIPLSASVSFYGDVYTVSFEDVDMSIGAETVTNAISISTNKLMQNSLDVIEIRDSIMSDYTNGVQTGTQELFCGIGDWEHGEIMQPYDVVRIEGENGYWRVTGRTFKYAGAPTLSLELQKIYEKEWHDIDIGSGISTGTISTGTFTENGEKTGSIKLPSGYDYCSDNSAYIVSVVFNLNGEDSTETRASMGTASFSKYNGLGIHTVHCTITANWANGILDYVAEEKYNKRAGYERRSYVKSITVTRLSQFY